MPEKPVITIYTDGGSKPNPGPGGWGVLLLGENDYTKELSGADPDTTNNRMELTAAIEALRALNQPSTVTLHTDSEYLKNGITRWLKSWLRSNWITTQDTPVKNRDLWQALNAEIQRHDLTWQWVKGHAGNQHNERVDQLATMARQALTGDLDDSPASPASPAPTAPINAAFEIAIRVSAGKGQTYGGWAVRITETDPGAGMGTVHTDRAANTTSNQLVLRAAAEALRTLPPDTPVRVICPDDYLFKGMTEWVAGWQQRNWQTASKKPVQNRDLWQDLLNAAANRPIEWVLESRQDKLPIARGLEKLATDAALGGTDATQNA